MSYQLIYIEDNSLGDAVYVVSKNLFPFEITSSGRGEQYMS